MSGEPQEKTPGTLGLLGRSVYATAGIGFVALGAVGVVVPGLPTTVFLIVASWLFARSCPGLERRLLEHPRFGPPLVEFRRTRSMPRRAKIAAVATMWTGIALALVAFHGSLPLQATLVGLGAVGTVVVAWYVRTSERLRRTS